MAETALKNSKHAKICLLLLLDLRRMINFRNSCELFIFRLQNNFMNMEINSTQPSVSESARDVVLDLLQRPFSSRSQSEQKAIACMARPMPKLLLKTGKRSFQESWYVRKDWLCASEVRKSLFCWPCLLFNSKSTTWTYTGYVNMRSFLSDCQKNEKAKSHMECYKTWKTFKARLPSLLRMYQKYKQMWAHLLWICVLPSPYSKQCAHCAHYLKMADSKESRSG